MSNGYYQERQLVFRKTGFHGDKYIISAVWITYVVALHYIPHLSCSDFFNFLLITATATTTITMRGIITTTVTVAIAAIVPPLKAEESS